MLLQTERAKGGGRIHGEDLLGRSVGKKSDRNGDQPAHEMRVAGRRGNAGSSRFPRSWRARTRSQTWLTQPRTLLRGL